MSLDEETPLQQSFFGMQAGQANQISRKGEVVASVTACIAALSGGMVLGYTAEALPKIQQEGYLSPYQASWFGSVFNIGAMIGGLLAGSIIDRLGRKFSAMMCALPFVTGWLVIIASSSYIPLHIGRTITGIGQGMISLIIPMYISEVTSKDMRGMLGAGFQLTITVGVLLSFGICIPLSWGWSAVVAAIPPTIFVFAMLIMPETPRWLLSKGHVTEAVEALQWLRGPNACVDDELRDITDNLSSSNVKFTFSDARNSAVYRPVLVSFFVLCFQQLSGINAVIFYTDDIFTSAGFSGNSSLPTLAVGIAQVFATIIGTILTNHMGRKVLLTISGLFMSASCVTLGLYYYLTSENDVQNIGWLSLASLLTYIIAFSLGWGPLPWLLMSELIPLKARGLAGSVATLLAWTCSFIVTKEFADLQNLLGNAGTFWCFGVICFCSVVFVLIFVPETKGKSLEDIEQIYERASRD